MPIITIVLVLCAVGFVLYLIRSAPIPIDPWIRSLIMGVVAFALIIWLLTQLGVHTGFHLKWS